MKRGRARTLVRRQQAVARAHREPVGFAHRGAAHDAGVQEEGVHEALDELQLLEVLLAEIGAVRAGDQQELQHDGQHAVEVARARRALELQRGLALADAVSVAVAVDFLGARHEHEFAAGIAQHREVLFPRARIAPEVGGVVELRGIDEDAGPGARILRLRAPQQREMALVQRPERRHEARRARAAAAPVLEEFVNALDDLHAS